MKLSKRTILWIVPLLIIGVFYYFYGPQKEITNNDYITFVKNQSLQAQEPPAEKVLTAVCTNSKWIYFKTQSRQNVVEYTGNCPVADKVTPINLQFTIDKEMTASNVGVLLIDQVQQSPEQREVFLHSLHISDAVK